MSRFAFLLLRRFLTAVAVFSIASVIPAAAASPKTEQVYLSGHGPKDAVPWEFSVTGGRRAGEWTTIPVPSNWEQQGFGAYNYGEETPGNRATEHGLYRLRFRVPDAWKDGRRVRLVFDGVMTDLAVKINGQPAGPTHQGGFYRFRYDITARLKPSGAESENLLEVDVAKVSANPATEGAERTGDYWVFGGIYRPVYLEAVPAQFIDGAAIDARADGSLKVRVALGSALDADLLEGQVIAADGQMVGAPFTAKIADGADRATLVAKIDAPKLWTAETPNLYSLRLTLSRGQETLHAVTERFGFRTFETRAGQGLFLNGQRILLKGVGRHSFRPETARALDREDCYADAQLIKEMNMNAVRMTHYPPDPAFLEACDELGLYVLDELSGWQRAHDSENGRLLVREMVTRDVNHPSILFWDNGNEGGWNRALDSEFALYDPQNRPVLHPWEIFNGIDTKHYPVYNDLKKRLAGPNLVMPTEMIHGLYDGGAGAGLEDYWNSIAASPFGGGGFIWVFADEGIARTDQNGRIDVYSTFAPDGIVGPRHEKEGSFYTVRDLYSPVQIDAPTLGPDFDGKLTVHNRYDFNSLAGVGFQWRLLRFRDPANKETASIDLMEGRAASPDIAPHASGPLNLELPANWREADALALVTVDAAKRELWTWTWPTPALGKRLPPAAKAEQSAPVPKSVETFNDEIRLRVGNAVASFDPGSGALRALRRGGVVSALTNGPRLVCARPDDVAHAVQWLDLSPNRSAAASGATNWNLPTPQLANTLEITLDYPKEVTWAGFRLEISPDGQRWKTIFDSSRRARDGNGYEFPPQIVRAVRLSDYRRSDGGVATVKSLRMGYQPSRFPAGTGTPKVSSGTGPDAMTGQTSVWVESEGSSGLGRFRWTLQDNGELRLDYTYHLEGEFTYHGITFDHPEESMKSLRWLGEGPYRVWQNRLRGTTLGVHEIARNDLQPGESWNYPEFQGCFAGLRWARLDTAPGPLTIVSAQPETYLRVGTPSVNFPLTTPAFPAGDLSFLRAIPAMGSKFIPPEKTGPASQPAKASGEYSGTLTFKFGE
jgi:hypothetical protein